MHLDHSPLYQQAPHLDTLAPSLALIDRLGGYKAIRTIDEAKPRERHGCPASAIGSMLRTQVVTARLQPHGFLFESPCVNSKRFRANVTYVGLCALEESAYFHSTKARSAKLAGDIICVNQSSAGAFVFELTPALQLECCM